MNTDDRIALLLGRAVMRTELLTVALEQAQARITELEAAAAEKESEGPTRQKRSTGKGDLNG